LTGAHTSDVKLGFHRMCAVAWMSPAFTSQPNLCPTTQDPRPRYPCLLADCHAHCLHAHPPHSSTHHHRRHRFLQQPSDRPCPPAAAAAHFDLAELGMIAVPHTCCDGVHLWRGGGCLGRRRSRSCNASVFHRHLFPHSSHSDSLHILLLSGTVKPLLLPRSAKVFRYADCTSSHKPQNHKRPQTKHLNIRYRVNADDM
jgi:hypothetical protein